MKSAFTEGINDTRKRVLKCYPNIKLDFLDEEGLADEVPVANVLALEAGAVRVNEAVDAPSARAILFFFIDVHTIGRSCKDGYFCRTFTFFFSIINEILFGFLIKCDDSVCMVINIFGSHI